MPASGDRQTPTPNSSITPNGDSRDGNADHGKAPVREIPLEEDIMQLARLGEIKMIENLFSSGKFDAKYKDEEGITPLHWAAIGNHYALCHYLIQAGADVNAKGGEVSGTPAHWAARKCNYYIVNLLLEHGADPLRTDDQGFNLLQNATMDGNVYQLLLLLFYDIPVDIPDEKGHTSLMWAAYNGFPSCVELLLQWGASLSATDEEGFTALHWALVKGSYNCIQKLVEAGADRHAKTVDGKTPDVAAREMNSMRQWKRALDDSGYNFDGTPKHFPLASLIKDRRLFLLRFFFFWPFLIVFCMVYVLSGMPIYAGLPISIVIALALQFGASRLLQWAPINMKQIQHTPWLAGVFAATLALVGVRYITHVLPTTFRTNIIMNIAFMTFYGLCSNFYIRAMLEDPGYVPKSNSRATQKAVLRELVEEGKFDEHHFCIKCMVRKPLRSKHCGRCQRCVAKHDHHCPWVNNCVGVNTHRHFFYYILTMELGVILVLWLSVKYLELLPAPSVTTCNIISDDLCEYLNKDPFTVVTMLWTSIHLTWVSMLIFVQLVQVSRAQTTYENMKGHTHLTGASGVVTSAIVAGTTNLEDAELTSLERGPDLSRRPATSEETPRPRESCFQQWKKLLGVDTFVATAMYGSRAAEVQARQNQNPFTRGVVGNCKDFFCDPAPIFGKRETGMALLGGERVDYMKLYEPPRRRSMRTDDSGAAYTAVDADDVV